MFRLAKIVIAMLWYIRDVSSIPNMHIWKRVLANVELFCKQRLIIDR